MPINKIKYLIIGSGPTGLGAAYRLKELGEQDFLILERNSQIGGLATSYQDPAGFTWDIGGHVQFSHYPYFDEAMVAALGKAGWLHHQREAWVWLKERFVPYPFQNNIHRLPETDCQRCLQDLEQIQNQNAKPENFKQWLHASFGQALCDIFLYPYNFKVWAYPPEMMNYRWIGERVSQVDLNRIKQNIKTKQDDVSWGPNNTFQFPLKGGTGAIWQSIGELIGLNKFRLNKSVTKINAQEKYLELSDNTRLQYDYLLSTMPLDILTSTIEDINPSYPQIAAGLLHSATNVVGIGVKGPLPEHLRTKCWMYFPESNCPFYRVTVFSNYSPNNVPDGNIHYSLMTEISESTHKPVDQAKLIDEVIEGLINTKLLDPEHEIVSRWKFHADYGYPTPSLKRDEILQTIIPELDKKQIFSRGRFGAWKYEVSNQDHSFMQGVEWSDFIINGKTEATLKL